MGADPGPSGGKDASDPLKVAIVGCAPGMEEAPLQDDSWMIWSLSRNFQNLPRADAWFELHKLEDVCKTWRPGDEQAEAAARKVYLDWLDAVSREMPVFLREPRPDIVPYGQVYPLPQVLEAFPRRYFTNTVSYMMAFAILMDADEIGIWGVDMELSSEYGVQRPSVEYFIGIAEGRGIPVTIPERSDLLKARKLYGFEEDTGFMAKINSKCDVLKKHKGQLEREIFNKQVAQAGLEGAIEMLEYVAQSWER